MSINSDLFRAVMGRFATGVTVVTIVDADGTPHGMTVSAFSSVSLEPPLVLVCIDHTATMSPYLPAASHFVVNVLTQQQEELSRRFSGSLDDRFVGVGYSNGGTGAPILDDVLAWVECRIVATHEAGDHTIYIGEVLDAAALDGDPLLYFRGGYAGLAR